MEMFDSVKKMSELVDAAKKGDLKEIKYFLEDCGIDVNRCVGEDGDTALYWAACNGRTDVLLYLLSQQKAEVNVAVKWGSTPLHAAADRGHRECVLLLCKWNAFVNCQNYNHMDTPLHLAAYRGHLQVCQDLLQMGANITIQNRLGNTCLDEARNQKQTEVYRYLIQYLHGSSLNQRVEKRRHTEHTTRTSKVKNVASSITMSEQIVQKLPNTKCSCISRESDRHSHESLEYIDVVEQTKQKIASKLTRIIDKEAIEKQAIEHKWQNNSQSDGHYNRKEVKQSFTVPEVNKMLISTNQNEELTKCCDEVQMNVQQCKTDIISRVSKLSCQENHVNVNEGKFQNINLPETFPSLTYTCQSPIASINQNIDHFYQNKTLDHATKISYIKTIESLQLQLTKARDEVTFLEKKHLDIWTECEHYRGRTIDLEKKLALYTQYEKKYNKVLLKNEQLEKTLKESEERSRSLALLLYKYQTKINKEPMAEISREKAKVKMDKEEQKSKNELFEEPIKENIQKSSGSSSCSSGSSSSLDSITHRFIASAEAKLSHSDLYTAILPIFQSLGDVFQRTMAESLTKKLRKTAQMPQKHDNLYDTGNEWVCGEHYVLSEERPINRTLGQVEGSSSLVFRIKHKEKQYVLKMMINLLDISQTKHGAGQSYPLFLHQQFAPEHDIPTLLPAHPNIVPVLHYYNGSTVPFMQFLPHCIPPGLSDSIEMANETTFIVMPEYPTTLGHFFEIKMSYDGEGKVKPVHEAFVMQKLYEILSAVNHLQENKVVHRDIKADNVFLDHNLRAIIGDFGFARMIQTTGGTSIPFVERSQVIAGNSAAWSPELAALNRDGPESLENPISLEEIYETTDSYAVGNMFYNLLCYKDSKTPVQGSGPTLPECYSGELRNFIQLLKHTDLHNRLTARRGTVLTGLMMFGPEREEVTNETECQIWHHARMMKLLVKKPSQNMSLEEQNAALNVQTSIVLNEDVLERHFFISFSPNEMWKEYKELLRITDKE